MTTAICNHTETSLAVLITIIYKEVGFSTQLITETNCWSSQLPVYNHCRKKTIERRSSEMNNRLDKVCVSFLINRELKGSKWISTVIFFPHLNTKRSLFSKKKKILERAQNR